MPYTTIVAGTTITASWANASVRDQVVTPFADSAARSSAITSPVNGMISALTTTDRVDIYNGSSWSALVAPSNGPLTSYTPSVTQSGAVTVTVTNATYVRTGRMIQGNVRLDVTGSGTGSNAVNVSVPIAPNVSNVICGAGYIYDTSVSTYYPGAVNAGATNFNLFITGGQAAAGATSSGFTAALASGDVINFCFHFEVGTDA